MAQSTRAANKLTFVFEGTHVSLEITSNSLGISENLKNLLKMGTLRDIFSGDLIQTRSQSFFEELRQYEFYTFYIET